MTYKHLFVMDPLESLNLQLDSSLRLMKELTVLGHQTFMAEPRHLSWHSAEKSARAKSTAIEFGNTASEVVGKGTSVMHLADFDAIHMRKDPPYDMDYITTTWLLDSAQQHSKLYNHPNALRTLNEKLAIFHFASETHPGILSADSKVLLDFIKNDAKGDGIIKPLTLFGGRGVERINLNDGSYNDETAIKHLDKITEQGHSARLMQPFDCAIFEGEVRVFTAFGEPIAWCLKRPAKGEFLANTRVGAVLESYTPKDIEVMRVKAIAESLIAEGVVFIGFDIIGSFVSEINITSPRLLTPPGDNTNYYIKMAQMIQDDIG